MMQLVGIIVLRHHVQKMWVLQTLVHLASQQLATAYLLTAYHLKNAQESLNVATQLCRVAVLTTITFQMVNFVTMMEQELLIPQWSNPTLKHVTLIMRM